MTKKRRRFSTQFKFKVALEAAKETKTINQIASDYDVHPNQVSLWKKQLIQEGPTVFNSNQSRQLREQAAQEVELYEQIGRLKMELEWLKKNLLVTLEAKREMIETGHPDISIRSQCELIGLCRSTYYYRPATESPLNLLLMRLIDLQYTKTPYFGYLKMTTYLNRIGYQVNPKRTYRLMRLMGIQAIYPKPRTSVAAKNHKVYPYLLRGLEITRPDQVWCSDITYIPMNNGIVYLVAVMDWFSRYVIAWELSNTLDSAFCLTALDNALALGKPEIFNIDQGSQFIANAFTTCLQEANILISMDGRGRAMDNIFIERLWRSVKYEDIYLKEYTTVLNMITGLKSYFDFYNVERPHQGLDYRTPAEVYFDC